MAGYQGPLNVDFVITAHGVPYLIEINPRRSALVDALGAASTLSLGKDADWEISVADYVEIPGSISRIDLLGVRRRVRRHRCPSGTASHRSV